MRLQDGLLRMSVFGQTVAKLSIRLYRLDGQAALEARASGDRLVALLRDGAGRPLANGVYLAVITVERWDSTVQREVRKIVILR